MLSDKFIKKQKVSEESKSPTWFLVRYLDLLEIYFDDDFYPIFVFKTNFSKQRLYILFGDNHPYY
jgi:hypothetical protein